ncbi:MAG: DUF357 domain-containing protein [Candidatus Woesearchaeota archaeon]
MKLKPEDRLNRNITPEKLAKYFDVTGRALKKVKIVSKVFMRADCNLSRDIKEEFDFKKHAEDFLDMAQRYYSDAKHFEENGDIVNAFACLNYAHGWLDAGARLGLFDVDGDNVLFTVDVKEDKL